MTEFVHSRWRITRRSLLRGAAAAAALPLLARGARAADWPNRPVTLVVPFAAGGTTDMLARLIADDLTKHYGQQFVIVNKGGASGNIAASFVARAAPDGYTFIVGTPGIHATNRLVYRSMGYDPVADLAPVIVIARVPNLLSVTKTLPVTSVAELIDYARRRPRELVYGVSALGSTGHLSTELFRTMTGIEITPLPFKGSAPMLHDLAEGRVHLTIDNLPSSKPHIEQGAIRALAVTTAQRWASMRHLPTIAESGLPGYDTASWFTIGAPRATPPEIITSLNTTVAASLGSDAGMAKLREIGAEPGGGSPDDMQRHVLAEIGKWEKVAKTAGISPL
ncbi:tripartite-type tricarboxylate transporter receptor subunit TctC [Rhodopseudomonas thermotolerans]|uniref:Tripartite-type tricarboxylate transporter receptor subunit TctC n=2 Tax=Rhodopseudomonas TaxID=1073 RepID=A0A336JM20_9BRAD|nr:MULTISPECIES: tripartite tricarboxylate transporter substrate binding protein [Rhodopseudomonas]RED36168.1 tripartite-type tricarboxylate transporter receptor subunit TctC [Rhodopseudomonas pentothenatexigens]REG03540.1 tripartite-type tricarboxylate transporter receptor subunit TctC [Rhodopseudomonas thermotolerans]SSW90728.1 tripartite-type tricarboxylate transporter receptor subunit TctC [Rhodopseudomonas pentothenatexigens]